MRRKLQVHHQQETHAWSAGVHKDTCGYLFLAVWVLLAAGGLSLVAKSGGYSLVAVLGPLIPVTCLLHSTALGTLASTAAAPRL